MSSLLRRYEAFVRRNHGEISSLENSVRSLTYMLPGRFNNAELASETIYALLNVLTIYNDSILHNQAAATGERRSALNKYLAALYKSTGARGASTALAGITLFQRVAEMYVKTEHGDARRWDLVLAVEGLKATLRLYLLFATRKPLLPLLPERVHPLPAEAATAHEDTKWVALRTRKSYTKLSSIDNPERFVVAQTLTRAVKSPDQLVDDVDVTRTIGEVLGALRPVVYVMLVKKHGIHSYKPFLTGLAMDVLSLYLFKRRDASRAPRAMKDLEANEARRRWWCLFLWLLKRPAYDDYVRERLDAFRDGALKRPIVSILGSIIRDYQPLFESYYFYTSGS